MMRKEGEKDETVGGRVSRFAGMKRKKKKSNFFF
jgi:hypothetical protein